MTSQRQIRRAIPCALALLFILSGCTTMTASGATEASFCQVAKPIAWSSRDTDPTIEQVKEHNAVGAALCGWHANGK